MHILKISYEKYFDKTKKLSIVSIAEKEKNSIRLWSAIYHKPHPNLKNVQNGKKSES